MKSKRAREASRWKRGATPRRGARGHWPAIGAEPLWHVNHIRFGACLEPAYAQCSDNDNGTMSCRVPLESLESDTVVQCREHVTHGTLSYHVVFIFSPWMFIKCGIVQFIES